MEDDMRPDCRYGSLCYQKNPDHHAKFKHSFKRKERSSDVESQSKKLKPGPTKRPSGSPKSPVNAKNSKSPLFNNKATTSPKQDIPSKNSTDNKCPLLNNKVSESPEEDESPEPLDVKSEKQNSSDELSEDKLEEKDIFKSPSNRNSDNTAGETNPVKRNSDEGNKNSPKVKEKSDEDEFVDDSNEQPSKTEDAETSVNVSLNNMLLNDVSQLKNLVKEKYLVPMPDEFFSFWKLCRKISPKKPLDAFRSLDIKLVGPFDILNGQCVEDGLMVTHWRHFYDPPEFQTIMVSTSNTGLHFGYFRDSPDEPPVFIASNSNRDCKITPVASNLFTFINEKFNTLKTNAKLKSSESPSKPKFTSLQQKVSDFAHALKIDLEIPKLSTVVRGRKSKTVCKGLSGAGIVVPYTKKTELGYRPLAKSDKELDTLFRQYKDPSVEASGRLSLKSNLQEVCTWVTIAMDESDFGTGLEFGLDLFGSGIEDLHPMVLDTLEVAYQFLNRYEFSDILKAHLENRKSPYVNLLSSE